MTNLWFKRVGRVGAAAAVAVTAGCAALPGGDLAERAAVERFLITAPEGDGFAGAQVAAFQMMARESSFDDPSRRLAAAYYRKARAAQVGDAAAPWRPADFGVTDPRLEEARRETEIAVARHAAARPTPCAMAVARFDGWLSAAAEDAVDAASVALLQGAWMIALNECAGGAATVSRTESGAVDALFAAVRRDAPSGPDGR